MSNRIVSLLFAFMLSLTARSQNLGNINGFVRKSSTQEPLAGVSIRIIGLDRQTMTDSTGFYRFSGIETKAWNLEASSVGFRSLTKFDIQVTSGNTSEVNFDLEEERQELQGVVVRANFPKPVGVVNSVQSLSINEIVRYPGANFDMAKVVQSFPGVSGSASFRNDIIIRGGAPNENVYYLDGVEIPTINHFATQGAAGGPAGILNVAFLDRVTLHTSAFPAKYDNVLSGVLQFRQRNGNPEKYQGNFRLSASEAALTAEGPLGKKNGKTTFIASARRSYLQLLFKLIDLPFVPNYWDYQYKITHKPNKRNEISIIGIGTIDEFSLNKPEDATLEQLAVLDQVPLQGQLTYTFGVSWRHTMKRGFWQLTASRNYLRNEADKFENNDNGNEAKRILGYGSKEAENRLRYEINIPIGETQLNAGANLIRSGYDNNTFQRRTGYTASYSTAFNMVRYGAFVNATRKVADDRLTIAAGIRTDGNTYTTSGHKIGQTLSPRLSLAYSLVPGLNVNAAIARYYRLPSYTILGFQENNVLVNKDAAYTRSDHFTGGLEWLPNSATRVTAEGFYKKYGNYPVSGRLGVSMANFGGDFGVFGNERVTFNGIGEAFGYELLFQQRLTKNFYGIMAYTWYHSRFSGIDHSKMLPSAWDNRHLLSFTGGYRFKGNWEIGLRFRYLGGAPYTPYDIGRSLDNYPFTYEAVLDYARLNTNRLRGFHAADLRIDKKFNFRGWTFDLYMDIQNAYNSQNPSVPGFTLKRNADETYATTTGEPYVAGSYSNPAAPNTRQKGVPVILENTSGALLPSIGFVVEF